MSQFWNERYAADDYVYGTEPNEFLKAELPKLKPGRILFPGEGEGRNAVFAAQSGWDVTAFDSSFEGKAKAARLAAARGVSVNYILASYDEVEFAEESFDCLVFIYTHMPAATRREYHQRFLKWLKPGGKVILEGFSKDQIRNNTGGPKDVDMLWSDEELQGDFAALQKLNIEELETELREGDFHKGKAAIIRLTGTK